MPYNLFCIGRDSEDNIQIAFCENETDFVEWERKYSVLFATHAVIETHEQLSDIKNHIDQQLSLFDKINAPIAFNEQLALRNGEAKALSGLLADMQIPNKPIEWSMVSD